MRAGSLRALNRPRLLAGVLLLLGSSATVRAQEDSGPSLESAEQGPISPQALSTLIEAQSALIEARALSAQLDEHAALTELLGAERKLREILHVPSVHVWLAEIWLQMGIIAAQRDEMGLAHSLLSRALSLDASRQVGAAEAAPKVVALVADLLRERAASPRSRFRIEPSPAQALSSIDGRELGRGPIDVELSPGPHLLRVTAPDYQTYAVLIEAWVGNRPPLRLSLIPDPLAKSPQIAADLPGVRLPEERGAEHPLPAQNQDGREPKPRWFRRWPVWISVASVAAAGAVTLALTQRDEATRVERQLRVDPGPTSP